MKSNSGMSVYEDKSFDNQNNDGSVEETEAYPFFFNNDKSNKRKPCATLSDKGSHSDSSDSDGNVDYYQEKYVKKFKSHTAYQDLSYEQDFAHECSTQNIQDRSVDDVDLKYEAEENSSTRATYENNYHFVKKQKSYETKNKTDRDDVDEGKDYNAREQSSNAKPTSSFEDKAARMMQKMGYQKGHGLGKNKQGRLEPVQASKQHGRRGLGHQVPGLEDSGLKWNPEEEEIKLVEDMEWIASSDIGLPTLDELLQWLQTGPKNLTIYENSHFCHEDIVRNVIDAKSVFDRLDGYELRRARTRCNPYETIRGAFFLNRAAVKMANIDKACGFMFTNPECLETDDLLYFADVCAGPGGFSEYVLWRKKWHAKGFGFTLKNENDFTLDNFYAGSSATFHPYYGPKEDGDVFDPSNQNAFRDLIMKFTHDKGVHFMMSDGGFSVEGQENIQEILSKQLYLCQCLVALMIVRTDGHFVTKLFDLFTPFSAGLVYLMYRCFEEVCIFKPNSSRPANSERYLICKRKRTGIEDIIEYLKRVNHMLLKGEEGNDVLELVPLEELEREKQFVQYLRKSNYDLGKKQIIGLQKIAAFCEDSTLVETKQADMRKDCLKYWDLPDESRRRPRHVKPQDRFNYLVSNSLSNISSSPTILTQQNLETILSSPYNWFCMPCGTGLRTDEKTNATFYLCVGRGTLYRYIKSAWELLNDINIDLPPDTLVYAEIVYEITSESKCQMKVYALHIIDAFTLGGEDISEKYLMDRHMLTKKFCEALWKPEGYDYARVRVKEIFPVRSNICENLKVKERMMKTNGIALVYELSETPFDFNGSNNHKPCFKQNSVIFLKCTAPPWNTHYSKRKGRMYLYNWETRRAMYDYERLNETIASFTESYKNRVIWYWPGYESLNMETFAKFIAKACPDI